MGLHIRLAAGPALCPLRERKYLFPPVPGRPPALWCNLYRRNMGLGDYQKMGGRLGGDVIEGVAELPPDGRQRFGHGGQFRVHEAGSVSHVPPL